jgi:hypothetical protein
LRHLRVLLLRHVIRICRRLALRILLGVLLVLMVSDGTCGACHDRSAGGKPDSTAGNTSSACDHVILLGIIVCLFAV